MDHPKLLVSIQKEECISTQRVNYAHPRGAAAPQPLSISSPDIRTYTPLPSPPSNCSAETETPPPYVLYLTYAHIEYFLFYELISSHASALGQLSKIF